MDRDSVKEFVKEVLGPNTEIKDHPKWVGLRCPLAPWTHERGADSSPSAGISVKEDDISIFNCMACGTKGPLPYLLKQLERYTGDDYSGLIAELDRDEFLGVSLPEWGHKKKRIIRVKYADEEIVELYDPLREHSYLEDRGITPETAERIGLLYDPEDSEGEERIVFPVRDIQGRLMGLSGRAISKDARLKVRDYHGFEKSNSLLGAHLLHDAKRVVVVEGLFDFACCINAGVPAVAVMFAGLTEYQQKLLRDLGLPVVLFYDNDKAGRDATERAIEAMRRWVPLSVARYRYHTEKSGEKWKYKDPGQMPDDEIVWSVENARIV